jgi:WD40 repeat protein
MAQILARWPAAVVLVTFGVSAAAQERAPQQFAFREIRGPVLQPGQDGPFQHINHVVFSPDGKLMAGGAGATIFVWNVADGKEVVRMQLPTMQIYHRLVFGPHGKTLVWCGREDVMMRIWDVATGRQLREFRQPTPPAREAPDGRKLPAPRANFLAFSPDGKRAAYNGPSFFKGIDVLDIATGKVCLSIAEADDCRGCAFSPDGKLLAAHSGNGGLCLWDAHRGDLVRVLRPDDRFAGGAFKFVVFSPDGKFLGSGGHLRDGLDVWNVATGKLVCSVPGKVFFHSACFAPDNQSVVCVPANGQAQLYHLIAEKVTYRFNPPDRLAHFVTFSPDGKRVAIVAELSSQILNGRQDAIYLYDVPASALSPAAAQVDDAALDKLWAQLSSSNDLRLQRVQQALRAAPQAAVDLFRRQLPPVTKELQAKVELWIAQLDALAFTERDRAMQELARVAFEFTPLLEARKKQAGPGEVRNRLTFVLDRMKSAPVPATIVKQERALKLLEEMATPAAQTLLTELAAGAANARLTVQARAALERLSSRPKSDR